MNENSIPLRTASLIVIAVATVGVLEAPWLPETPTVLTVAAFYMGLGFWSLYIRTGRKDLQWYLRDPIGVLVTQDADELSLPQVEWAAVYTILLSFAFGFLLLGLTAVFTTTSVAYSAELYLTFSRIPIIAIWIVLALGVATCVRYISVNGVEGE